MDESYETAKALTGGSGEALNLGVDFHGDPEVLVGFSSGRGCDAERTAACILILMVEVRWTLKVW